VGASLVALYIVVGLVLLVLLLAIFVWRGGGRYARALLARAAQIPALHRAVTRAYLRELEKTNPVAARAYAKLEHVSGKRSARHTERALSVLSPAERRAYLELFGDYAEQPLGRRAGRCSGRAETRVRPRGRE
jgi:hypothetical protein